MENTDLGKMLNKRARPLLWVVPLLAIVILSVVFMLGKGNIESNQDQTEVPEVLFIQACKKALRQLNSSGAVLPSGTIINVADYYSPDDNDVVRYFGIYPEEMKLYIVLISDRAGILEANYYYDIEKRSWIVLDETFNNTFESSIDRAAALVSKEAQQKYKIDMGENVFVLNSENIDNLSEIIMNPSA